MYKVLARHRNDLTACFSFLKTSQREIENLCKCPYVRTCTTGSTCTRNQYLYKKVTLFYKKIMFTFFFEKVHNSSLNELVIVLIFIQISCPKQKYYEANVQYSNMLFLMLIIHRSRLHVPVYIILYYKKSEKKNLHQ